MKQQSILVFVIVLVEMFCCEGKAVIYFNDGGEYDITKTINDGAWVEGTTTVNIMSGADILHDLTGFDYSQIYICDG